jgi:hypothetical protein
MMPGTMPMMTLFEPLFILLVLASLAACVAAAIAALRGERPRARRIVRRLARGAAVYGGVVLAVAFLARPPLHRVGEPLCSDDWCITVTGAKRTDTDSGQAWRVTLRISSRAKRIVQGERYAAVYLTDSRGREFRAGTAEAAVPLDTRLGPGESVDAIRRFELPADATGVRLVFTHEGGFPIGALIVGENEFFHRAAVVRLD